MHQPWCNRAPGQHAVTVEGAPERWRRGSQGRELGNHALGLPDRAEEFDGDVVFVETGADLQAAIETLPAAEAAPWSDRLGQCVCRCRPVIRTTVAKPSSVPGQCARTASRPARRTTPRSTTVTMIASSA